MRVFVFKFLKNNTNTDLVLNFVFTNREKTFKFLMNNNDFLNVLGKLLCICLFVFVKLFILI